MFPSMNMRILNIRASQSNGTVSFSGVFSGYRNENSTNVDLNVDPGVLEKRTPPVAPLSYADINQTPVEVVDL